MATTPDLIYCGGGNPRFYEIAREAGFLYGAQLPDTVYGPLYFTDQDWKKGKCTAHQDVTDPSCLLCAERRQQLKARYLPAVEKERPHMASVIDWEWPELLPEVLEWAEEIAPFVDIVMLIPKAEPIAQLPRTIGGKKVRLGYSVPTNHGGTAVPVWEFYGWPVHLLGGSPHEQMALVGGYRRRRKANQRDMFRSRLCVVSADGNMAHKMANQFCAFWDGERSTPRGYWPTIKEYDGRPWGDGGKDADAPYEAFRRSCKNIMEAWRCM